jgi:hypothetical protein
MVKRIASATFRKRISLSILAATLALCAGCGSVAKQNPAPQIATLQDGATTYAQVIDGMGKPYQDYGEPDGGRTVVYLLNPQPPAADTHSSQIVNTTPVRNKLTLIFDPNGILASHSPQPTAAPPSPGR